MLFKNIITTTTTRLLATLVTAFSVLITANLYGAEGRGQISLLIVGISITNMFSSLVGGGSIVYIVPRSSIKSIYIVGFIWSIFSSIIISAILLLFNLVPAQFGYHIITLAIIQNILQLQQNILLGKNNINAFNTSLLLQSFITITLLIFIYFSSYKSVIDYYLIVLYISYFIPTITSYISTQRFFEKAQLLTSELKHNFNEAIKVGYTAQIANIAQLISYRFNFYLLNNYVSIASVGVYSTAVMFIDSILIIAKSIALNLYSSTANHQDKAENIKNTISYSKMAFWLTVVTLLIVAFIPNQLIELLFGNDFKDIKNICIYSCVGIFSFSLYICYSHYFAGIGKFNTNRNGSSISAIVTIITGLLLVPLLEINGAIASSILANFSGLCYLAYSFKKHAKISYRELIPKFSDWKFIRVQLGNLVS